jgi:hypothetical protein
MIFELLCVGAVGMIVYAGLSACKTEEQEQKIEIKVQLQPPAYTP